MSRRRGFAAGTDDSVMGEINVTPMVDIMLVLLIVFIITAPVLHEAFRLNLPRESAERIRSEPRELTLLVSELGEYSIDGAILAEEQVLERLVGLRGEGADAVVRIRADSRVRYGAVAHAMGLIRQAGIGKILFVTQPDRKM